MVNNLQQPFNYIKQLVKYINFFLCIFLCDVGFVLNKLVTTFNLSKIH